MSAPFGLAPHQVQAAIDRAWEKGFFKGPHERERFESYDKRPLSLRQRFEDLTGFWPSDELVEWWSDDGCPHLRGVTERFGSRHMRDYVKVSEKCWDLFMQSLARPIVNWEEA